VSGKVLHIADAATTIRNLSRRIGDERPAAGNIIWQPVKQMKMGWEINYGEAESFDKTIQTEALQAVWGTWFYF
jgi:hypothetical protein